MESHTFFPADLFLSIMIQILSMLPFMQKGWQLFSCYNAGKMKGGDYFWRYVLFAAGPSGRLSGW